MHSDAAMDDSRFHTGFHTGLHTSFHTGDDPGDDPWDELDPEGPSRDDLDRFGGDDITCPMCGADVYFDLETCPGCGAEVGALPHGSRRHSQRPGLLTRLLRSLRLIR